MSELRQIPRWQIGEKAKIRLKDHDWEGKCSLENLNLKGLKMSLKERLPHVEVLELNLDLKNILILNVEARICWKMEIDGRFYYGMEFSRIKDFEKEQISQYLFKNHQDQFKDLWWPQDRELSS